MSLFRNAANDLIHLRGALAALRNTKGLAKAPEVTTRELVERLAARFGDRPALLSDRENFTYRHLNARANQYARWARSVGVGRGDTVALMMTNRPEFMAIWLGIARAGGATALINTGQTGPALGHSLRIVKARWAIVEDRLLDAFESATPSEQTLDVFAHGEAGARPRVDIAVGAFPDGNLEGDERVPLTINDRCIYVYTSGTTGMPKAANINHYRVQLAMLGFAGVIGARSSDRMYVCLPMYHTNGGVLGPGSVMAVGGSCFIRDRFSASEFWADLKRQRCTAFVYIGELCRYLVNTPPTPSEADHGVRLCFGNGLRPDVWQTFRARFDIPRVIEFYAATEGNCSMFNFDGTPGAVGRIPAWLERRFPVKVVEFDVATEMPCRDAAGRCIECRPDQVGEAIGQILNDPERPANRFEGYADATATERKILRDVFTPGDAWFRTGDLLRRDARGYFFFVDRIGDTYRWKGENVATSEVAEALTSFPGLREAIVYGVPVPGVDGKAGMASVVVDDSTRFDPVAFFAHVSSRLADYARPTFVRLADHLDVTGTFKQRKVDLVAQGFDPSASADPVFVADPIAGSYVPVDAARHAAILARAMRL